jgi:nucleoside-diphosphate-sugar epimerase
VISEPPGRWLAGTRVAVTGASGFCGAAVARQAEAAGADVVCLGRRPGPVGKHIAWDAARHQPDLAGADVVIHLAAAVGDPGPGREVERSFRAVNVDGSRRLLDASAGRPVVWVSSASVYDPRTDRRLVRESHPVGGQLSVYGRTKAAGEQIALDAGAVVLRPRAVYGPGDGQLVPRIVRAARAGVIVLPGPDVRLSLTAVGNLADACLQAPNWPAGAYNIADERPYWRDAAVRAVLGPATRLLHAPLPLAGLVARSGDVVRRVVPHEPRLTPYSLDQLSHHVVLDISKAVGQGWRPRRTLDEYLATGID